MNIKKCKRCGALDNMGCQCPRPEETKESKKQVDPYQEGFENGKRAGCIELATMKQDLEKMITLYGESRVEVVKLQAQVDILLKVVKQ